MVRDPAVHCLCATFRRKLVQAAAEAAAEVEEAEEARVAPCRVHRTEAFTEVLPLAIQKPVDGFPPVLKRSEERRVQGMRPTIITRLLQPAEQ